MIKKFFLKATFVLLLASLSYSCVDTKRNESDINVEKAVSETYRYVYTNMDSALYCLHRADKSLLSASEYGRNRYMLAHYHVRNNMWENFDYNDTLKYLVDYFEKEGSRNEQMRLYYIIGSQYERRKNTMEALTWLRKGWELAQNEKEQGFDYSIYSYIGSLIGWILMEEGSSLLAKDYIIESSRYIDKRNDSIMGLSLISMAYNLIEEYDSARLYANRTFEAIKKDSTNAFYIDRLVPQIEMYIDLKDWESVKERMPYVLKRLHEPREQLETALLAEWYIHERNFRTADSLLRIIPPTADKNTIFYKYRSFVRLFSDVHQYDSAFYYAKLCIQYEDSILKQKDFSQAHVIDQLYNLQIAQEKENKAIREKYRMLYISVLVSILLLITLLSLYLLWKKYKSKTLELERIYLQVMKRAEDIKNENERLKSVINNADRKEEESEKRRILAKIDAFKKKLKANKTISNAEKEELIELCMILYPNFDEKINAVCPNIRVRHKTIGILTLLDFKPYMISNLMDIEPQLISYSNKFLSTKIVGKEYYSTNQLKDILIKFLKDSDQ